MKIILSIFLILISLEQILSQPKQEIRAVWLTTNLQLDWPPKSFDPEIQKKALIDLLDDLARKKFNTIYFQVRSQGSVLYKSQYEPWSQFLTGTLGGEPFYDPLKFFIEEAHRRFFEVHAWVNMIRCKIGEQYPPASNPLHLLHRNPEWIRKYFEGNNVSYWLDPGLPEVREYLKNICTELALNYNIDGIHFDFIRYPGINFDDSYSYSVFGNGMKLADWRRENINTLVTTIYDTLISMRPMLKVGSAPVGIYENLPGARGLEGRNSVYQDSREWLKRNKQDYLVPQIYWDLENNPRFDMLINNWVLSNYGKQIVAGVAAYDPKVFLQLEKLISISRVYNSNGQSFFRYENISGRKFTGYSTLSNIPPMSWKDNIPPNAPYSLMGKNLRDKLGLIELVWGIPQSAADLDTAKYYNVYRSVNSIIDRNNSDYLLSFSSNYYFYDYLSRPSQLEYYYQISSLDKGNNESIDATEIVKVELTNLKNILRHFIPINNSALLPVKIGDKVFYAFDLEISDKVKVILYDNMNRFVSVLYDGLTKQGRNVLQFDSQKITSAKSKLVISSSQFTEEITFSLKK